MAAALRRGVGCHSQRLPRQPTGRVSRRRNRPDLVAASSLRWRVTLYDGGLRRRQPAPRDCFTFSGMRLPNSGLPEFGKYYGPSRQQPTWLARARKSIFPPRDGFSDVHCMSEFDASHRPERPNQIDGIASKALGRNDTASRSRGTIYPSSGSHRPPKERAQGMPGAWPHPQPRVRKQKAHEHSHHR